ncbi:hypothetical protein [Loigolactobacillus bifermentans]|uniref:Uncharacterized protein n=1 Tax=Loigolactobacillus bifermentans DSM 20003 TaxID=1423726 RepID=A0A0R1GPN0_9LACO|nr:hypothetical protein [Loigolactobacillus bifermentans]KRK34371.1 hypothetical protein FC07_GL000579 [Loigolactobacillus bifermentans DSM 20003]QGG60076.1 hypothetical protein LB003_06220 [Loigolactobacillus bifermentans]
MADLITKGMPDWQKPINDFAAKNAIVVSPWSTTGITYTNGFGPDSDTANALHYRTVDQGSQRTIQFAGWIKNPALVKSQKITFASIPVSLFKGYTGLIQQYERYAQAWSDLQVAVGIDPATGEFSFQNRATRDTGAFGAGGLEINYSVTW